MIDKFYSIVTIVIVRDGYRVCQYILIFRIDEELKR